MPKVMKRNRENENWSDKKVKRSIEAAAREAGYPDDKVKNAVDWAWPKAAELQKRADAVNTMDIRETILRALDERYPEASAAWRSYDKAKAAK